MVAEGDERRPRYRAFGPKQIGRIPQLKSLSREQATALSIASLVFPFRVNEYVLEELIDWSAVPSDPMYQLTFPQAEMLDPRDFAHLSSLVKARAGTDAINDCARSIQLRMNPHPSGQMDLNVPKIDGRRLVGCQHKYRETVLYFPSGGQSCHAYCTYCFRWPQFVGIERLRFATRKIELLVSYLRAHHEVTNVLVTGGDPLVMSSNVLRRTIEPLLGEGLEHITSIRIGTKALSYWPYRFTTDADADEFLQLAEDVHRAGKHLAIMAHVSHAAELYPEPAQEAVRRLRDAGCIIRSQAPLIRHVNDSSRAWAEMWKLQLDLGIVPYYMFVERDTGAKDYFEVPLARAYDIYRRAIRRVPGTGRTARPDRDVRRHRG